MCVCKRIVAGQQIAVGSAQMKARDSRLRVRPHDAADALLAVEHVVIIVRPFAARAAFAGVFKDANAQMSSWRSRLFQTIPNFFQPGPRTIVV